MRSLPRSRAIARTAAQVAQVPKNPHGMLQPLSARGRPAAPGCASDPAGRPAREALLCKGSGAFLGTTAKSVAAPGQIDPETGEINPDGMPFDKGARKVERFMLQKVVKGLMGSSRTAKCLRWLQANRKEVEVWRSHEYKTASFAGLQTCGSVWACPVCAAKIAERRRVELLGAMTTHKASGGTVFMLTLTAPHQRTDALADLLPKHRKALLKFWGHRAVKRVLLEMGVVGQIRAAEVTHGRRSDQNNGWHPHHHVLLFAGSGVGSGEFGGADLKDWACRLYLQWAKCCESVGLGVPSYAHGLRLDDGSKAASYVAKWGLEDEMTKGHTKKASKGETPFDFLRAVLADAGDNQGGALFVEFAQAFKGKRQLTWSPGLKARFAVGETTDEELAAKTDDSALLLGKITLEEWRLVLKAEGRALVLQLAESGGWEAVERYLSGLGAQGGASGSSCAKQEWALP